MNFTLERQGSLLAHISEPRQDMPWFEAQFEPTPAFEEVRPLFARAAALVEDPEFNAAEWEAIWRKVRDLGVRLVPESREDEIEEFALCVDGSRFRFRYQG